jgi:diguanylate cyclase (GGDEF)-like protein
LRHEQELADANHRLELLATTDSLTGLARRRVFEARAELEMEAYRRKHREFSILLMDIDNFKQRNDTFGHAAGDAALKVLAKVVQSCVRVGDLAARLGGEEFAILLPETGTVGAMNLAGRIQSALAKAFHGPAPLTISIGVASLDPGTTAWQDVLTHADGAMYEAKRRGKNQAVIAQGQEIGSRK